MMVNVAEENKRIINYVANIINNDWLKINKEFIFPKHFLIMSSEKQVDEDNETVASSTEKTDEQEETKSKSNESDNDDTDSNASSEYEVVSFNKKNLIRRIFSFDLLRKKFLLNVDVVVVDMNII
jgi:hypothetical protein